MYPLSNLRDCTSLTYFILYILLILSKKTSAFLALSAVNNPCNPCVSRSGTRVKKSLRPSALALWNFASGEPAKGRIPQGKSAVNLFPGAAICQLSSLDQFSCIWYKIS